MDRSWRVVFRGPVPDEELAGLPSDRMIYVSGHIASGHKSSTIWVRAPDAAAAEQAVRAAISTPGVVVASTPLPYWISIGLRDDEIEALERTLSEQGEAALDNLIVVAEDFAELSFPVDAETALVATRRGLDIYRQLRRDAALPPAAPPYFSLHPPSWPGADLDSPHRALLARAQRLLKAGDPDLAVAVAQTACEVLIAQVINERLEAREIGSLRLHILSQIRSYTLLDGRTQKLWKELTSDEITHSDAWKEYRTHVQLRHAVVHKGVDVSADEASASLTTVHAIIEHIEDIRKNPLIRDGQTIVPAWSRSPQRTQRRTPLP